MSEISENLLSDLASEAIEFFAVFSRLEHALIWGGFVARSKFGHAIPNWILFAEKMDPDFYDEIQGAKVAQVLPETPRTIAS